jgi:bacterioferritin-associated ferredoxin
MTHSSVFSSASRIGAEPPSRHLHDQIQIALAIADETVLKAMLVNCRPAIAPTHHIGHMSSAIGIAAPQQRAVDGIIEYESIQCLLAPSKGVHPEASADFGWNARDYQRHTQCESDTFTLAEDLSLSEAEALLLAAEFTLPQAHHILHIPPAATHKTWWFTLDERGHFTVPFLRALRTVHFANGTVAIKYKDYFERVEPPCFRSDRCAVLVEIQPEVSGFSRTLERINRHRIQHGIDRAILIVDKVSDFEAHGFISQGISLYPAIDLLLPMQANCGNCQNETCPLKGDRESPVALCRAYRPDSV